MRSELASFLEILQGPVFRFAFALMVLGLLRQALIRGTEALSACLVATDRAAVRRKLYLRIVWFLFPHRLLKDTFPLSPRWRAYHTVLSIGSLMFRLGAIIVPAFMVAHVYLWERALGVWWPALPAGTGDAISFLTIGLGLAMFFGRLYSPLLRRVEPAWGFLTPLILILPFITGVLAMHPTWSPIRYQVMLILHVLSACAVFVLLPFAGLLALLHSPITRWVPSAAWREPAPTRKPVATQTLQTVSS